MRHLFCCNPRNREGPLRFLVRLFWKPRGGSSLILSGKRREPTSLPATFVISSSCGQWVCACEFRSDRMWFSCTPVASRPNGILQVVELLAVKFWYLE